MKKHLNGFLLMIQFMTRIPVNKELSCNMDDFRIGISYFPIIGLIVGGIQYLIYFLLQNIIASEIAIVIAVIVGFMLMDSEMSLMHFIHLKVEKIKF